MKALRAILLGILLWVLIFVEISIVQKGLKITSLTGQIIHYIFLIPFVVLCVAIYYQSRDKFNGFFLGIFLLLIGNIFDLVLTIPLFIEGGYAAFYSDIYLWIGFAEVVIVTGVYDLVRKK